MTLTPKTVTSIDFGVFGRCNSLTSIVIPDSVISIGEMAFATCVNLENIVISDNTSTIGDGAFHNCKKLSKITIPQTVNSIGAWTFYGCSSLYEVNLPESLTTIGDLAFYGCESLTEIIIPTGTTSIADRAFANCSNLTRVVLPESVTFIHDWAFDGIDEALFVVEEYSFSEHYCQANQYPYVIMIGAANEVQKLSPSDQVRVAANNLQNLSQECYFATDGESVFCNVWDDDGFSLSHYIRKADLDNFSFEEIREVEMSSPNNNTWNCYPYSVSCINGILYLFNSEYNRPVVYDTNMDEIIRLPFADFVTDGEYYYVYDRDFLREPGIFRIAIRDVTDETKYDRDLYSKISDLAVSKIHLQGKYLYAESINLIWNGEEICRSGFWRMNMDGGNPILLSEHIPRHLLVSEDRLYFADDGPFIYSANLDWTDIMTLTEANLQVSFASTTMNISGNYIFYTSDYYGRLHRINIDGTNDIQLNNCDTANIVIAGDWVIYLNEDDHQYYKMRFDGSNHCLVSDTTIGK